MPHRDPEREVARRLPWLLVFRGGVATLLLIITAVADAADWPIAALSVVMYGVAASTYVVVFALGVLLRQGVSPVILGAVHLVTAVAAAIMVMQATGGVESPFSFLYLLVVLDGAIIGGRRIAMVVATVATAVLFGQAVLQQVVVLGTPSIPAIEAVAGTVLSHAAAFYLVALLAGRLARLLESAREEASTAASHLFRAEVFNAAVLESLPVGVLTTSTDRVESANAAAARILERPIDEMAGSVLPVPLRELVASGGGAAEIELETSRGKRVIWAIRSPVLMPQGPGEPDFDVLVLEDRTEIRVLEAKLRARERLATIGQMVAAMAHELRNPLAAISGSVELLRSPAAQDGDGKARERLEAIVLREIERLDRLINDLLVYARPSPPARTPVDLTSLTRELCSVVARDAAWSGREISVTAPERLMACVDAGHVRQVLWNLLRNALEASPRGTPVEIRLDERSEQGHLWAGIVIRDYGEGVTPEIREHLFEPFQSTKRGGTGLGLAVVHSIVGAHGGSIELLPAEGRGTEACLLLPVEE